MRAPIELIGVVGRHAFDAGVVYAQQGRATVLEHDAADFWIHGYCRGSGARIYTTNVSYERSRNGVLTDLQGRCSCPVQTDCKHAVALLIAALDAAERPAAPTLPAWEKALGEIFGEPGRHDSAMPLALLLDFQPPPDDQATQRAAAHGWGRLGAGSLPARPARQGTRSKWIASGATWSDIQRGAAGFHSGQFDALRTLGRLFHAASPYMRTTDTWYELDAIESPSIWRVLREGVAAGLTLLESNSLVPVTLEAEPARAEVAIEAHPDGVSIEAVLDHPLALTQLLPLGSPPHGFAGRDGEGWLHLLPLEYPATKEWVDLRRHGRVVVPADDRERFERELLPRITRKQVWSSPDESFVPAPPPATVLEALVTLTTETGEDGLTGPPRAELQWQWRWGSDADARVITLEASAGGMSAADDPLRDADRERELLAAAARSLSALPSLHVDEAPLSAAVARGRDAVTLVQSALPVLREIDGIEVTVTGELPIYRDAGAPEVQVAVVGESRDWFDLEVTVNVGGQQIPVGHVIRALVRRERTLFLPDGGYLTLERPELDQLRNLIEEGRALQDHRREGLRVSRLQVSWWDELMGLGIVDQQTQAWLETVRATRADQQEPPPLPDGLTVDLRPYQREGYEWLAGLRRAGLGGVLADDMGLGKTVQTLAMIADARADTATALPSRALGAATSETPAAPSGPFLVVAPTSVVPNWAAEAARFTPNLRVVAITQTSAKSGIALADLATGADIVVTSYALFRLDYASYEGLNASGLILDEAQNVKNYQSKAFSYAKRLPVAVKFAITGTPMENNLTELWAMFAISAPGLLGNPTQFGELYRGPIERGNGASLLPRLRRRIAPFLLRRTKEAVAPDLPAKQEQILDVELSPAHRRIYAQHLQRERQRVMGLMKDLDRNRVEVLSALTRLRQLAIDPGLVDPQYAGVASSKLEALLPLLEEAAAEGHRVLVFSQFTRYLGMIAERLDTAGLAYSYLDGSTKRRAEVISGFANGTQPVFLISLKAGGVGLNLAMADYCVLADPWWNPATEAQAIDRAHRIGQTRPVMVYRLVSRGTIEEKVMALQETKRDLVAGVLGEGEASGAAITAEDIRSLMD